jgi:hypothetical protein
MGLSTRRSTVRSSDSSGTNNARVSAPCAHLTTVSEPGGQPVCTTHHTHGMGCQAGGGKTVRSGGRKIRVTLWRWRPSGAIK